MLYVKKRKIQSNISGTYFVGVYIFSGLSGGVLEQMCVCLCRHRSVGRHLWSFSRTLSLAEPSQSLISAKTFPEAAILLQFKAEATDSLSYLQRAGVVTDLFILNNQKLWYLIPLFNQAVSLQKTDHISFWLAWIKKRNVRPHRPLRFYSTTSNYTK